MKRFITIAVIIVAVLLAAIGLIGLRLRAERPDVLIAKLARSQGSEHTQVVQALSLARGDVIGELMKAFEKKGKPEFRAEVIDLIFKRNLREPDDRLPALVQKALKDPSAEVRRAAASGLVLYCDEKDQTILAESVSDDDEEVRRQVYALFASCDVRRWRGVYGAITPESRTNLVESCRKQMKQEADPETAFLARSVVGLEISSRCEESVQALGGGDFDTAKKLLEGAFALDPENKQVHIRMARLFVATGDMQSALEKARQYGALISIPKLASAPVIDGDPSDDAWKTAYKAESFYHTTSKYVEKPTTGKSRCNIGHYNGRIYISMIGFEDELDDLLIKHTARDEDVWLDDCVELAFNPDNSESEFSQFIINPAGALMDNKNGDKSVNFNCDYKAKIFKDRGYWAAEFSIELSELSSKPVTASTVWSMNMFRARLGVASEHGAMWPMYGSVLRPGLYPLAVFEGM